MFGRGAESWPQPHARETAFVRAEQKYVLARMLFRSPMLLRTLMHAYDF